MSEIVDVARLLSHALQGGLPLLVESCNIDLRDCIYQNVATDLSLFILFETTKKRQTILIHRSSWDDNDVLVQMLSSWNKIDFRSYNIPKLSEQLALAIEPHLKPDVPLLVSGYGLGGVHAVQVASLLSPKYPLKRVLTFAQPAFTRPKKIDKSLRSLPLLRVIVDEDPVPLLFPGCVHIGAELILLPKKYISYSLTPPNRLTPVWTADIARDRMKMHSFSVYIERLNYKATHGLCPIEL